MAGELREQGKENDMDTDTDTHTDTDIETQTNRNRHRHRDRHRDTKTQMNDDRSKHCLLLLLQWGVDLIDMLQSFLCVLWIPALLCVYGLSLSFLFSLYVM